MKHYSNFWLGNHSETYNVLSTDNSTQKRDYIKLASSQRAISNFVNIVTGKSIPVRFKTKDSYTDGKTITIASNLDGKNFDPVVGLALHEGSHIILSDFNLLKVIGTSPRQNNMYVLQGQSEKFDAYEKRQAVKSLVNIIEDRRIDHFVMTSAPGYIPYYEAMYGEYFQSKYIDKAIVSSKYATEEWESYLFHLINMVNKNRNLDALVKLREVYNLIDLANINRLKSTDESWELATEVFNIIERHLLSLDESTDVEDNNSEENDSDIVDTDSSDRGEINDSDSNETEEDSKSDTPELSDRDSRIAENAYEKQKRFINGDVKKSGMSKNDSVKVEAIAASDTTTKKVGTQFNSHHYYSDKANGYDCIIVNKISKSLVESGVYMGILSKKDFYRDSVTKGLVLGTKLGRKLQVRNDERTLKTNRLNSGKIDSRRIAAGGYGAEDIFSKLTIDKYNPIDLHISIDASGSMNGSEMRETLTSATAIAKAASMTNNINVVITARGEHSERPLIMKFYDSKVDKVSKLRLLGHMNTWSATPESLCFEAILDEITSTSKGVDKYFINFSDGLPGFSGTYGGEMAVRHCAKMVKKMTDSNVKVLSFFICSSNGSEISRFRKMYGKAAEQVSVTELAPLARSINNLFI